MRHGERRIPHTLRTLREPGFDIELAISPLAGMKGVAGYHSSILVAAEEYFFSPMGIIHSPRITSHKNNPEMKIKHMGLSRYSGMDLMECLDQHFPQGHYDLLRKNCNCFSDCALYLLCERRLDMKYRSLERLGRLADDHAGIIQSISAGEYSPNPRAVGFDVEDIIDEIQAERDAAETAFEMEIVARREQRVFATDAMFAPQIQEVYPKAPEDAAVLPLSQRASGDEDPYHFVPLQSSLDPRGISPFRDKEGPLKVDAASPWSPVGGPEQRCNQGLKGGA